MKPRQKLIPLWLLLPVVLLSFSLGGGVSWFVFAGADSTPGKYHGELRLATGKLTSPLLECEVYSDNGLKVLRPFKYKVEALLQEKIDTGGLVEGAVYFRDLNNGLWFGINEHQSFTPASLLKVPLMISYFKEAENNPAILKKELFYSGDFDLMRNQGFMPSRKLEPGKPYTVDDLIFRMIALSDNNAMQLLYDNIDGSMLDKVINDLDVNVKPEGDRTHITIHAYSGFFRVLYNASYLNRELSEKALAILSKSEFADGLRAGLPPGQIAATKFGEWGNGPDKEIVQLHEFGIVYYPGRPYLLGIMTRGKRGEDLAAALRDISGLVYESIAAQHNDPVQAPASMFK